MIGHKSSLRLDYLQKNRKTELFIMRHLFQLKCRTSQSQGRLKQIIFQTSHSQNKFLLPSIQNPQLQSKNTDKIETFSRRGNQSIPALMHYHSHKEIKYQKAKMEQEQIVSDGKKKFTIQTINLHNEKNQETSKKIKSNNQSPSKSNQKSLFKNKIRMKEPICQAPQQFLAMKLRLDKRSIIQKSRKEVEVISPKKSIKQRLQPQSIEGWKIADAVNQQWSIIAEGF